MAINRALFYVPTPKYFLTMDYLFVSERAEQPITGFPQTTKVFIVNRECEYLQEKDGRIVDVRPGWGPDGLVYDLSAFDLLIKSFKRDGLGGSFTDFRHGANSGFSAFQLALLLGYKEIYLLGYDLSAGAKTHWHIGYGELPTLFRPRLTGYAKSFINAIQVCQQLFPDVKIISCSPNSPLNPVIRGRYIPLDEVFK